ncbi:MAG: type II toxin-antitoxin system RelE/ParE family toxin [Runella sp.]
MNNVIYTDYFANRLKRFLKKFPTLIDEIETLAETLEAAPQTGTPMGAGFYKIRLSSKSKGKGKSGGFRVITCLVYQSSENTDIYLLTIYDKSEESNISKEELVKLSKRIMK